MTKRKTARAKGGVYRRILWPTDFSPLAKAALPHALPLAAAGGREAELIVLHVVALPVIYSPAPVPGMAWARLDKEVREAAAAKLRDTVEGIRIAHPQVRVRSLLADGSAFEQIPRTAKRLRCDLIVLATHGWTGLKRLVVGSVAENVVRRAPCPVLTVRPRGVGR